MIESTRNNNYSTIDRGKDNKAFLTEAPTNPEDKIHNYKVIEEYDNKFHKYDPIRKELNKPSRDSLELEN